MNSVVPCGGVGWPEPVHHLPGVGEVQVAHVADQYLVLVPGLACMEPECLVGVQDNLVQQCAVGPCGVLNQDYLHQGFIVPKGSLYVFHHVLD